MIKFSAASESVVGRLSRAPLGLMVCAGLGCVVAVSSAAGFAQSVVSQYKTIPTNAKFRDIDFDGLSGEAKRVASKRNSEARRQRTEAKAKARDGIENGNIEAAKDYLNGYVYPLMTQPDELADAGSMRDGFFRTFLRADLSQQARQQLISGSILPAMQTIAKGSDYYPAARLNAVAVIGRLDDRGLVRSGGEATPPIPSAAAFDFLVELLNDEKMPAYLKATAMQGITRHLIIDRAVEGRLLDGGARSLLTTFAVNTIEGKTPGQDQWKPELDYWLKRRSVQLIGEVGLAGPGGQFIELMLKIASDQTQTLWMQFDAVKSLRKINFAGIPADKASEVVLGVTDFLQRSLTQEATRIQRLLGDLVYKNILYGDNDFEVSGTKFAANIGKSGGMLGMGGLSKMDMMDDMNDSMFGGSGTKEPPATLVELPTYQLNLIRRRMKMLAHTCNDVLNNARGLAASTDGEERQLVRAVGKFTEKFMQDSNTGVVNLDEIDQTGPQRVSYTEQLQSICIGAADSIERLIARYKGKGNVNDDASGDPQPAVDPVDPLGLGS